MSSHWPVFLVGIFLLYSHEINQQGPQPSTFVFVFAFFSDTVWVWWWHCAQCHVQPHRLCVCLVFVGLMVAFLKTCICCSLIIQLPSICLSIMNALCYCTVMPPENTGIFSTIECWTYCSMRLLCTSISVTENLLKLSLEMWKGFFQAAIKSVVTLKFN